MDEFNYNNIIETVELMRVETTNDYIKSGWILLKIFGETHPIYMLGWDKRKGDKPTYPPKNDDQYGSYVY